MFRRLDRVADFVECWARNITLGGLAVMFLIGVLGRVAGAAPQPAKLQSIECKFGDCAKDGFVLNYTDGTRVACDCVTNDCAKNGARCQ